MPEALCPLENAARQTPDAPAIVSENPLLTFAQFRDAVVVCASQMHALGIRPRDTIAFPASASLETITLLLSCIRLGAVACPMNPRLPGDDLRNGLSAARATHFIGGPGNTPEDVTVIPFGRLSGQTARHYETAPQMRMDDPAVTVFTSGSMGEPKAALLSLRNLVANAKASNGNIMMNPCDAWLLSLPLYHVAGLGVLFRCLLAGAAIALPHSGGSLAECLKRQHVSHVSLVMTQLFRLLEEGSCIGELQRLKAILLGGSAISLALVDRAFALGLPIHTSYGLTEMASQVTTTRPGDTLDALHTSGHPVVPGNSMVSTNGEILVRGDTLFLGYRTSGGIERPLNPDGWFQTGDLGHRDDAGRLTIEGRKDNRFVCGGENVQPEEVERCLLRIDGIMQAIVTPVDNVEYGQVPVAFIQYAPGSEREPRAIFARLRESLLGFKIPKHILPWPEEFRASERKPDRKAFAQYAKQALSSR